MSIVLSGLNISGNAQSFRNFTVVATTTDLDTIGNGAWVYSGDTITAGTAGTTTIDGYTIADGDSVLVKNESVGLRNGIYEVNDSGVGVNTVFTRVSYLYTGVRSNSFQTWIQRGAVNFSSSFISSAAVGSDVIGTDDPLFVQYDARATLSVVRGGTGVQSINAEYTTPQTNTTYSVPAGAKSLFVKLQGAGGGGGSGNSGATTSPGGGGGGGAGMYRQFSIPITSSDTVTITVGAGGNGGVNSAGGSNGTQGGPTNITINGTQIIASGGGGGGGAGTAASGGGGGSAGSSTGGSSSGMGAGAAGSNILQGGYGISVSGVTGALGRNTIAAGLPGTSGGTAITRPDVIIGGSGGGGGYVTTVAGAGGQCAGSYFAATPGAVSANNSSPGASGGSSAMAAGGVGNAAGTIPNQPGAGAGGAGGQTYDADFGVFPGTNGSPGGFGYALITWS